MDKQKYKGFTLAEVLITITVIGVVAALTLPPLIHGYKKRVTETRLKQAYSILYQAKERAVADYGEMSGWEFGSTGMVPQSTPGFASQYLTSFFKSYIAPYNKIIKDYGYKTSKAVNHNIYFPSGHEWTWSHSVKCYIFTLQNGIIINLYLGTQTTCDEYNEDGSCKVSSIKFTDIYATVDVNGFAKPNKFNSDVFQMVYDYKNNKIYYYGTNDSLNNAKNGCYNGKEQQLWKCGGFIQKNNWIIPDDYPYKL